MKCISPILLRKEVNTNSLINAVPCGKCYPCLSNKRDDWSFRIAEQQKHSKSAFFLTLTYDEKNVPYHHRGLDAKLRLRKYDLQCFIKKMRKLNCYEPLKYYAVGEYGGENGRPHYHMILFNLYVDELEKLNDTWGMGKVVVGSVEAASIHYVTKYVVLKEKKDEFALISKGIGLEYAHQNQWYHSTQQDFSVEYNGFRKKMPRYLQEKLFDENERKMNSQKVTIEINKMMADKLNEYDGDVEKYCKSIFADTVDYNIRMKKKIKKQREL